MVSVSSLPEERMKVQGFAAKRGRESLHAIGAGSDLGFGREMVPKTLDKDNIVAYAKCQCFRHFLYEETKRPREVCRRLWELGLQWLKPGQNTKEQILELVILEKFLSVLPLEMKTWVGAYGPANCAQAVALAEAFLVKEQKDGRQEEVGPVTFEDVTVKISKDEWELLDLSQRALCWEVTLANYNTVSSLRTLLISRSDPISQLKEEEEPREECAKEGARLAGNDQVKKNEDGSDQPERSEQVDNGRGTSLEETEGNDLQCLNISVHDCSQAGEGPYGCSKSTQEVFQHLWELGLQWLKPEQNTREQILELVILEKFLSVLPLEMKTWVRAYGPANCAQAVALAEAFLVKEQKDGRQEESGLVTFEEVAVKFSEEEWALLDLNQRALYWEVMVANYYTVSSLATLMISRPELVSQLKKEEPREECAEEGARLAGNDQVEENEDENSQPERSEQVDNGRETSQKETEENDLQGLNISVHDCSQEWEGPYGCSKTGESFSDQSLLLEHRKSHPREKQFSCSLCEKTFSKKVYLTAHERSHTGEKPFKCLDCGKSFMSHVFLFVHKRLHVGERPFHLPEPGKKHMKMHRRESVPEPAKKSANNEESVVTSSKAPAKWKSYLCPTCSKSFKSRRCLILHQRTHTGEKPSQFSLNTHQKVHKDKKYYYFCTECGMTSHSKSSLAQHQRIHTGEKPFMCQECGKSFRQKATLVAHQTTHSKDKLYSCPDCEKTFKSRPSLSNHQKTHTDEKPYKRSRCEKRSIELSHLRRHEKTYLECGKSFNQNASVVAHQTTHSQEKLYSCPDCGKTFKRKESLRIHQRTHTGEKPYECSQCEKRYSTRSQLNRHKKTHAGVSCSDTTQIIQPISQLAMETTGSTEIHVETFNATVVNVDGVLFLVQTSA